MAIVAAEGVAELLVARAQGAKTGRPEVPVVVANPPMARLGVAWTGRVDVAANLAERKRALQAPGRPPPACGGCAVGV